MKTVILDGYAENPGDLSWDWLGEYGEFTVYDRTPAQLIDERCRGYDTIITNKTPLTRETLEKIDGLKYVGLISTGYNVVDWEYCKSKGIPVCNIPSYSTMAVAQNVFAHILAYTNQVAAHSDSVHSGGWAASPDFSYQVAPVYELLGKTIGIIGFGKIGSTVAGIAKAFGMKVLAQSNHPKEIEGVEFTDRDTLIENSDFITIHTPLTPETENMVNAEFLSKMKKSAMLINTSRGPVIDEYELADALKNGVIAAAGLDVMRKEPPEKDNPLCSLPNCSITPHIAWAGYETRQRLMDICKQNIKAYSEGKPINLVY
ncbi:MAG: D-2-hydroxyacid dehydrogenase [Clostridia bacterium]|nr:D-2-hydroxyacid dehydrogenase [Clostridia bacterium]